MSVKRLAVVYPSQDMVHADFALCLTRLVADCTAHRIRCALINPKSAAPQIGRHLGVLMAQEMQCDRLLFLDSDMTFPADTARRLLAHERPIVACAASKRAPPFGLNLHDERGRPLDLPGDAHGLVKVPRVGAAVLLIDMVVFVRIPKPWFPVSWDDDTKWTSEDQGFCDLARAAGYHINVDADLSRAIGHIGQYVYTVEQTRAWLAAAAKGAA